MAGREHEGPPRVVDAPHAALAAAGHALPKGRLHERLLDDARDRLLQSGRHLALGDHAAERLETKRRQRLPDCDVISAPDLQIVD